MIYRQGDILLSMVDFEIDESNNIENENNRVVLAHGEATGHTHSVNPRNAIMVKFDNKLFLIVKKETFLEHQEHAPINLPIGKYEIIRQREYYPKGVKNVED